MGGKSSSKNKSTTSYQAIDKRVVADNGAVAMSGDSVAMSTYMTDARQWADNSQTNVQMLDGGAIRESAEVVKSALQTIQKTDATNGEGFGKLLDLAGNLFEGGATALERSQSLTADAYRQAQETKQATIDNKTIVVIAIAGAAAVIGYGAMK